MPTRKSNSDAKSAGRKHRKRPPTVVSSDSDLDDDQLGITPRTPPESPFYRGHRNTTTPAKTNKRKEPSTTKPKTTDGNTKSNQAQAQSQAGRHYSGATQQEEEDQETERRPGGASPRAGQVVCRTKQEGQQVEVHSFLPVLLPRSIYKL